MANVASDRKSQKSSLDEFEGAIPWARGVALLSDPSPIQDPEITFVQSDPSPTPPVTSGKRLYHPSRQYYRIRICWTPCFVCPRATEVSFSHTSAIFYSPSNPLAYGFCGFAFERDLYKSSLLMPRTPDQVFVTHLVDAFFLFFGAVTLWLGISARIRPSATMGQMLACFMLHYNVVYWMILRGLAEIGWYLLSATEKRELPPSALFSPINCVGKTYLFLHAVVFVGCPLVILCFGLWPEVVLQEVDESN
jgi:hypothetical protein